MNKKSLYWGIGITVIWLVVIYFVWFFCGLKSPESLNELGDALAGIFAPIAFFWLILGYVQQGKQLDQNTKALEQQERALQLQIDEMKESVKQQKEIAELQMIKFEMNKIINKPKIWLKPVEVRVIDIGEILNNNSNIIYCFRIIIINIGLGNAIEISLKNNDKNIEFVHRHNSNKPILNKLSLNDSEEIKFTIDKECIDAETIEANLFIEVYFKDISQLTYRQKFGFYFFQDESDRFQFEIFEEE